jgi:hypothetical protein
LTHSVIGVIWPIQVRALFALPPTGKESAVKVQNRGMSMVYQRLEANNDVQHRSKSGSWKQRVTPELDPIPVQYSVIEFQR